MVQPLIEFYGGSIELKSIEVKPNVLYSEVVEQKRARVRLGLADGPQLTLCTVFERVS